MISRTHLYEEVKKAEDVIANTDATAIEVAKAELKIATVVTKLLHNIRSNQSAMMEKMGVKKLKPRIGEGADEGEIREEK